MSCRRPTVLDKPREISLTAVSQGEAVSAALVAVVASGEDRHVVEGSGERTAVRVESAGRDHFADHRIAEAPQRVKQLLLSKPH
jgi:hypothetical protein